MTAVVERCASCQGSGRCRRCGGSGRMETGILRKKVDVCSKCGGTGKCVACRGSGNAPVDLPLRDMTEFNGRRLQERIDSLERRGMHPLGDEHRPLREKYGLEISGEGKLTPKDATSTASDAPIWDAMRIQAETAYKLDRYLCELEAMTGK